MHTLYKARKTLPQSEGIKVRIDPSCRSSSVASIDIYYKTTKLELRKNTACPHLRVHVLHVHVLTTLYISTKDFSCLFGMSNDKERNSLARLKAEIFCPLSYTPVGPS